MDFITIKKVHYTEALKYFADNVNILHSLNDLINKAYIDEESIENGDDLDREQLYESDMSGYHFHTVMDKISAAINQKIPFDGAFYIAHTCQEDCNEIVIGFITISLLNTLEYYTPKNTNDRNISENIYNITGVGVRYGYRNLKICTNILKRIVSDFSTTDVHLSVFKGNIPAMTCYKNVGFVEDDVLEDEEDSTKYMAMIYHKKT